MIALMDLRVNGCGRMTTDDRLSEPTAAHLGRSKVVLDTFCVIQLFLLSYVLQNLRVEGMGNEKSSFADQFV